MAKKEKRRRKKSSRKTRASGRKPKRKVDRKLQSAQSLNPTSRLSGGPGSAGPWPMNPYGVSFGGMSMAGLRQQEQLRPKDQNSVMTSREKDMNNVLNNHIHLHGLPGGGASVSLTPALAPAGSPPPPPPPVIVAPDPTSVVGGGAAVRLLLFLLLLRLLWVVDHPKALHYPRDHQE